MSHHVIDAHWYYLVIGYAVAWVSNAVLEDSEPSVGALVCCTFLGLTASLLMGLGLLAILNWSVIA